ncbi:hypothetical protein ACR6C2_29230 [Streptomyces sp. INA 01156]
MAKSYQYSPWGERLSQIKHSSDGSTEDGYYGYNGHTDVETLTDNNGDTKATYGYTAYGSNDDTEFTGIDKPEAGQPDKEEYNPTASTPSAGTPSPARTTWASATTTRA